MAKTTTGYPLYLPISDDDPDAVVAPDIEGAFTKINRSARGLNVKLYGAVGDGATDDTAAISAANEALRAAGGGILFFPTGTYITSPQVHYANVVWQGEGRSSVVKLKSASNADLLVSDGFATTVGTLLSGPSGLGLRNITLDANKAGQTSTARCWAIAAFNFTVDDVWFINGYGGGVFVYWAGPDAVEEGMFSRFKITNYGGRRGCVGLEVHGPHDSQYANGIIETLDSTIRNLNSGLAYGATPISGGVALPTAGTAFTFTCTSSDLTNFPATGGIFAVQTTAAAPNAQTWTIVTYTASSVTGGNQTFTGCTSKQAGNVVASSTIDRPTYGILDSPWQQTARPTAIGANTLTFTSATFGTAIGSTERYGSINGSIQVGHLVTGAGITGNATVTSVDNGVVTISGTIGTLVAGEIYTFTVNAGQAGAQFDTVHVWGRHHVAWYASNVEWNANCEVEGGFYANVVLDGTGNVWMGGTIYGTNGQSGQVNEVGLQVGQDFISTRNMFLGSIFNIGNGSGSPINMGKTAGDNMIRAVGANLASVFLRNPFMGDNGDWYEIDAKNNHSLSVFQPQAKITAPKGIVLTGPDQLNIVNSTDPALVLQVFHTGVIYTGTADATGWTLPSAAATSGQRLTIVNASAYVVTLNPVSAQTISGASTKTIPAGAAVSLISDGTNWQVWGATSQTLSKAAIIATGLTYSDVGADAAGAIGSVAVTGTPSAGQVLQASGTTAATWASLNITGQYLGSASTFAGLPTTDAGSAAAGNGDWAILTADVVGTGSASSPQYPRGVYVYNGSAFSLGLSLAAEFQALTTTAEVTTTGTASTNTVERISTASGAVTRTLPTTPADGTEMGFKLTTYANGNNVTITCGGSAVFNKAGGLTTATLSVPNQAIRLKYRSAEDLWVVTSTDNPVKVRRSITAAGSTAVWNDCIEADTTSGAFAITLPAAATTTADITVTNLGANTLTLTGTVSGVVNPTLPQWSSRTIRSNGSVLYFV